MVPYQLLLRSIWSPEQRPARNSGSSHATTPLLPVESTSRRIRLPAYVRSTLQVVHGTKYFQGIYVDSLMHSSFHVLQMVTSGSIDTEAEVLELKAAVWACAHLGTSESGVALLESAQVVEAFVRIASMSTVLALRGTAFFALNLVAMTTAGVDILARFGNDPSIKNEKKAD